MMIPFEHTYTPTLYDHYTLLIDEDKRGWEGRVIRELPSHLHSACLLEINKIARSYLELSNKIVQHETDSLGSFARVRDEANSKMRESFFKCEADYRESNLRLIDSKRKADHLSRDLSQAATPAIDSSRFNERFAQIAHSRQLKAGEHSSLLGNVKVSVVPGGGAMLEADKPSRQSLLESRFRKLSTSSAAPNADRTITFTDSGLDLALCVMQAKQNPVIGVVGLTTGFKYAGTTVREEDLLDSVRRRVSRHEYSPEYVANALLDCSQKATRERSKGLQKKVEELAQKLMFKQAGQISGKKIPTSGKFAIKVRNELDHGNDLFEATLETGSSMIASSVVNSVVSSGTMIASGSGAIAEATRSIPDQIRNECLEMDRRGLNSQQCYELEFNARLARAIFLGFDYLSNTVVKIVKLGAVTIAPAAQDPFTTVTSHPYHKVRRAEDATDRLLQRLDDTVSLDSVGMQSESFEESK